MVKEKSIDKYNFDNRFSVRFQLSDDKILKHIPDNIFMVEMPDLVVDSYNEIVSNGNTQLPHSLVLTLRSTQDESVEKELYDVLMNTSFNVDISLTNSNKVHSSYKGCLVDRVKFSPLYNRPNKSNPFNLMVYISVEQVIYYAGDSVITIGNVSREYIPEPKETVNDTEI